MTSRNTQGGNGRKRPVKKAAKKAQAPRSRRTGKEKTPNARAETSRIDVLAGIKQGEALKLRTRGLTFRQIAAELNVDVATAHRYVKAGLVELAEQTRETSRHLRELELARLDELLAKVWPFATGDLRPLIAELEARQSELAELDPKKAKASPVAKLLETFVEGIPQDDYLKRALDIIKVRARLLGLEAPVKHAHTDPTGEEERAVPVAFPVPPQLDPEAWQAFAAKAAKAAQGDA